MKILAISGRIPAAEKKGDQVVSFFRLTYLAKMGHSIELICFGELCRDDDRQAKEILEEAGIVVHLVRWRIWEAAWKLLTAVFRPDVPFQCALYSSGRFRNLIQELSSKLRVDALYCVMVRVAPNAAAYNGKMLVEMVDSMGLNFSRRASLARRPMRWLLDVERRRVSAYEKALAGRAERSFVVSNIDRKAIDSSKVDAIPLGIDMHRFGKDRKNTAYPLLTFTGNMHYQPNADAVCWFVQHCWWHIKHAVPSAHLVIAGSNPQSRVTSLANKDDSISVTGRVPSIADVLNSSTLAIAPMQSGSGMQFKILEAMACGVPVVTTSLGLGDIAAQPGKDLLVGDSAEEFSNLVIKLIDSVALNQAVGDNGLNYVLQNHSWDALNERFVTKSGLRQGACS